MVVGIEHNVAVPVLGGLYPPAIPILAKIDSIVSRVQTTMVTIEATTPDTVTGQQKADATVSDFNAYINDLKSSLGLVDKTVSYDNVELQDAITSQHDAYTHFAKVKASIKIT